MTLSELRHAKNDELLAEAASLRQKKPRTKAEDAAITDDSHYVGLVGERYWCHDLLGLPVQLDYRRGGDNGSDMTLPDGRTIDVKTYRKPFNLVVQQGKAKADIFVLLGYREEDKSVEAKGWATKQEILSAPTRYFNPKNQLLSHYIPAGKLHPIQPLIAEIRELFEKKNQGA